MRPYVRNIDSNTFIYNESTGRWVNNGKYEIVEKNDVLLITDLPYDVTFKAFEDNLNDMVDRGYIKDWKNFSHDNDLDYRIQFPKNQLKREVQTDKIQKFLKNMMLVTNIKPNIFNICDENGKILYFEDEYKLLEYFVKWRLNKYNLRKDKMVDIMQNKLKDNMNMCKFIELVTSQKLVISNRKKNDIIKDLKKYELPPEVLSIQISKLTEEEKKELLKKNEDIRKELEYI